MTNSTAQEAVASVSVERAPDRGAAGKIRALVRGAWRFCRRQPLGALGAGILLATVVVAVFAPAIATHGINQTSLSNRLIGPSSEAWFGTDNLGRDQFSRIVYGTRTTLMVSLLSVTVAMIIAASVGLVSGYAGGWVDMVIQRVVDAWMAFPTLVLLLSLVAVLGTGFWQIVSVLALLLGMGGIRVVRATTLGFRNSTFVDAARVIGVSPGRIILRHIAPNLFGPLMVLATLGMSSAILAEAALSFLGFGVPPPAASWGRMLSGSSSTYLYAAPWLAIFPGLAITVVVFGVNMLGDALRDELDPRLRGSR